MARAERGFEDVSGAVLVGLKDRLDEARRQLNEELKAELGAAQLAQRKRLVRPDAVAAMKARADAVGDVVQLVWPVIHTDLDDLIARIAQGAHQLLADLDDDEDE